MAVVELMSGPALTHDPPSSITEHQTLLENVVRPALIEAADHLSEIGSSFTFTVTEAMQGENSMDADPLELDFTEILAMRAGLDVALAAIDVAIAYVLTPSPLDARGFVDALTPGSTFLTLATGGADALGDALARLQSAGATLLLAFDELQSETDNQADDMIEIDPGDLADARVVVEDLLDALSRPAVVTIDEGDSDEFSFSLDAREFFIDPITDFKTLLPPYEVLTAPEINETVGVLRWTALNLDEWTFPDPTFSGILPGMNTTSDLFDLGFDEFFFELSLTGGYYSLITADGLDCYADWNDGLGAGCPIGSDFFYQGSIGLDGYDGMADGSFDMSGPLSSVYSMGPYNVVDNLDGTYTVTMNTVLEDGLGTPLVLTGTFVDIPGFTSMDDSHRYRGGSTITLTYQGAVLVFEKQD